MIKRNSTRVFFINVTCGYGSTGRIVTGLYDILEDEGYSCAVAYGRGRAPGGYRSYRIGDDMDVNLHGVLSRVTDRQGFYSRTATAKLIKRIREFDPDIIHLHNIHGYYLNVELLFRYLKKCGKRVIWTLHDCWSFTGHCTHFEYIGCNKWQSGCFSCEQLKEYPKSILADSSARNYRQKKDLFTGVPDMVLVTPSGWLASKVKQSFMGSYPISVIPTGIDLETFKPTESDLREKYGLADKFVILGAANPWRDRKGLEDFKKLSRVISDRYKIVMVGLKPSQAAGLPSDILALPRTDSVTEMAAWYTVADAYVNLTLEDTFPTTNIEALACGTPVITYKSGGSPESLTEECGLVVPRSNMSAVTAALDILRTGPDRSDACMDRALEYSSENRFYQYLEEIYEEL